MANTRTRDVHWRLDPLVVRRLEEIAYSSDVSVSFAANWLLANATRPEAPADQKVIPIDQR